MKFAIITHVPHTQKEHDLYAYGPYVREMNLWLKHVESVEIVAPLILKAPEAIDQSYQHKFVKLIAIKSFNAIGIRSKIRALVTIPRILVAIFGAMKTADHIHLRCPGNIGLLGSFVQILFPNKPKTAKYAGNWDPKAKQPISYRIQKWILSNTFLTKNMQVLVYGEWPNQTQNVKSFFTASYTESEIGANIFKSFVEPIKLLFVGTLSLGKQPEYAFELVRTLHLQGNNVRLDVYGDGQLQESLKEFIIKNDLNQCIKMHGNVDESTVKNAYQNSHFLLLPSKSEGWPKVVAEALFWGCIPFTTSVSCLPSMLGHNQERGFFLSMDSNIDAEKIQLLFNDANLYMQMSENGKNWSRNFTLERFSAEIRKLLLHD